MYALNIYKVSDETDNWACVDSIVADTAQACQDEAERKYTQDECHWTNPVESYDRSETSKAAAVLGRKGGKVITSSKSAASRTNGKLGGRMSDKTEINLENLWSGSVSTMTWGEIKSWCETNVYPNDRKDWIKQAREATRNSDSKLLGKMIIGS